MAIALSGSDKALLSTIFERLPAGGQVKQLLKTESWGDLFGYFVDKYGVNWIVNITVSKS